MTISDWQLNSTKSPENRVTVSGIRADSEKDSVRSRIGELWPQDLRERVMQNKDTYPFLSTPTVTRLQRATLAMGLMKQHPPKGSQIFLFLDSLVSLSCVV